MLGSLNLAVHSFLPSWIRIKFQLLPHTSLCNPFMRKKFDQLLAKTISYENRFTKPTSPTNYLHEIYVVKIEVDIQLRASRVIKNAAISANIRVIIVLYKMAC